MPPHSSAGAADPEHETVAGRVTEVTAGAHGASRTMETGEMSSSRDAKRAHRAIDAWRDVFTDALDVKRAAERLHVSSATVDEMIHHGELVAVRLGGVWLLPAWQFTAEGVLPGVRRVLEAWPGSTVTLSVWACTPSGDLRGRTPAQALEDSDLLDVSAALPRKARDRS